MDFYKRPQTNTPERLWLLCAAIGTLLLVFVPSAAWLNPPADGDPYALLSAYLLKQILAVALLLIVPALWARAAHAFGLWTLIALSALAFGFGFFLTRDAAAALYALLLAALPGAGLYVLQRLKLSNFRTVLYASVALLFALFGYVCLKDLIENGDAYLPFKTVISAYERMAQSFAPYFTAESGEVDARYTAILDIVASYRLNAYAIGIPILAAPAMCAGLSNVLFSHLLNRRGGAELTALPPFAQWRCERPFVYAATALTIVSYVLAMMNVNGMDALSAVAMLVWRLPCALAGLATVYGIATKLKKRWIFVIVCCGALTLPTFGLTMLSLIGMIASLRKPMNDGKDGTLV